MNIQKCKFNKNANCNTNNFCKYTTKKQKLYNNNVVWFILRSCTTFFTLTILKAVRQPLMDVCCKKFDHIKNEAKFSGKYSQLMGMFLIFIFYGFFLNRVKKVLKRYYKNDCKNDKIIINQISFLTNLLFIGICIVPLIIKVLYDMYAKTRINVFSSILRNLLYGKVDYKAAKTSPDFKIASSITNEMNIQKYYFMLFIDDIYLNLLLGMLDVITTTNLANFSLDLSDFCNLYTEKKEKIKYSIKILPQYYINLGLGAFGIALWFNVIDIRTITYRFITIILIAISLIADSYFEYKNKCNNNLLSETGEYKIVYNEETSGLFISLRRIFSKDVSGFVLYFSSHFMLFNLIEMLSNNKIKEITSIIGKTLQKQGNVKSVSMLLGGNLLYQDNKGNIKVNTLNIYQIMIILASLISNFMIIGMNYLLKGFATNISSMNTWILFFNVGILSICGFIELIAHNMISNASKNKGNLISENKLYFVISFISIILTNLLRSIKYIIMDDFQDEYLAAYLKKEDKDCNYKIVIQDVNYMNNRILRSLIHNFINIPLISCKSNFILNFSCISGFVMSGLITGYTSTQRRIKKHKM